MLTFENGFMILSSGRRVRVPQAALALDHELDIWTLCGDEGEDCGLIEQFAEATELKPEEVEEIALLFIDRWATLLQRRSEKSVVRTKAEAIRGLVEPHIEREHPNHHEGERTHHDR